MNYPKNYEMLLLVTFILLSIMLLFKYQGIFRILFGLIYLLYFHGRILVDITLTNKEINSLERHGLSLVLSFVIVSIFGHILLSAYSISLHSIYLLITFWNFGGIAINKYLGTR
jgi:uncharacterized membrane protein